jgi:ribonuclease HI
MKNMKPSFLLLGVLLTATVVWAESAERYLHVRVNNPTSHELVRVNVPLSLAEKVVPAINHGELRNGKIRIGHFTADKINIRAVLDALKTAPEGEFVTVQEPGNDVRVAKEHGQLVVHVIDKGSKQNVDVTVPWEVAQALISNTSEDELDVVAAIKALANAGDVTLVTVTSHDENIRVWIDSNNSEK